jgi:hypothetical protein
MAFLYLPWEEPENICPNFERDDFFASGTFGGETVSLAACLATVDNPRYKLEETIQSKGHQIQDIFNDLFKDLATCEGYPTRLIFKDSPWPQRIFMQEMCFNGNFGRGCQYGHGSSTRKKIFKAITDAIKEIAENFGYTFKLERETSRRRLEVKELTHGKKEKH